jgi:diguanylate cyclase (GGDEF)-like protein
MLIPSQPKILLASANPLLRGQIAAILQSLGLEVQCADTGEAALTLAAFPQHISQRPSAPGILLLDACLDGIAGGRLLASLEEAGVHPRLAIALISSPSSPEPQESLAEECLARLREGIVDGIVPSSSTVAEWRNHLVAIQRAHRLACELERLREAGLLREQHDRLTGTLNRETAISLLFRETDRVQRLHGVLGILLLDIDDFGHWNLELGMDACDQLLQQVAGRLGKLLRSYDLLARVGKDEFLLALPGCSPVNTALMAERLRMEVFGEPFLVHSGADSRVRESGELRVRLSACFGLASSLGRSPVVVLRDAEQALARAKFTGPDSIACAGEQDVAEDAATWTGFANRCLPAW